MALLPVKSLFLIVIFLACAAQGCKQAPKETNLEYYYYPKTNMYYSVSSGAYYFSLDGGKTWDTLRNEVAADTSMLGDKVVLYAPNDSIWADNEAHRMAYKGSLYNFYDEDTLQPIKGSVTDKPVAKKKVTKKPVAEPEPKKKGLKKFFNKIFGKKKDK